MIVTERRVQEIGKSLLITLPKAWAKALKVEKGTRLKVLITERGGLSIVPEFVEKAERKMAVIPYDANFNRRFFKEYFEGNERIVIRIEKEGQDRKGLYSFLRLFMNTQVIEESEAKMVVKCFRIDELSMQECLQRMHHLSLAMLDEFLAGKKPTQEMRDNTTRFYYMLVMQIRRFLSEGQYVKENKVSLLTAMDYRMVAEKVQRIVETASTHTLDRQEANAGKKVRDYYARAFRNFLTNDYASALPLWNEEATLRKRSLQIHSPLRKILRFAKEISMLVR